MALSPNSYRPFLFLYTTAGGNKLSYRRGILDALCYPAGHVIRYHYRLKEIAPEVLKLGRQSLPGVIIFVDSTRTSTSTDDKPVWDSTYYPLRLCEILDSEVLPSVKQKNPETRINFSLKLGPFVQYDVDGPGAQWHKHIQTFDEARGFNSSRPTYFVISASDCFNMDGIDKDHTWEALVGFISRSTNMAKSVFLRLERPVRRPKRWRSLRESLELPAANDTKQVQPFTEGLLTSYTVKSSSEYRIDISIFDSAGAGPQGKFPDLEVTASSDQLYVAQPFHSIVSGLVERSIIVNVKRASESLMTTLAFEVTDVGSSTTTNAPVLHLYITPNWLVTTTFVVLVFIGSFLVTSDDKLPRMLGSLSLTGAAFIAYRRLPIGSKS